MAVMRSFLIFGCNLPPSIALWSGMSIQLCFLFFSLFKSNEKCNLWGRCSNKNCIAGLYQKAFYNAGCLMANSLIQGGPSPAMLADWCHNYIASKENFAPTDFSLPEQFKERCDIKKVNLVFSFLFSDWIMWYLAIKMFITKHKDQTQQTSTHV